MGIGTPPATYCRNLRLTRKSRGGQNAITTAITEMVAAVASPTGGGATQIKNLP